MDALDQAREFCYNHSRRIVRESASAIRLTHRGLIDEAREQIVATAAVVGELLARAEQEPWLASAGFVLDALKEHVEAHVTLRLVTEAELPGPEGLGVPDAPYLNGVAEAIMELRRHLVDLMRDGDIAAAARKLDRLDDLYFTLTTFDYPDAILQGLRHRLDTVRSVVERTRSELVTAARQASLERRMASLEQRLPE